MPEETRVADRLEQLEKEARAWAQATQKSLAMRLLSLNLHERIAIAKSSHEKLQPSLRNTIRKNQGELDAISFSFARHGIFLERGVGKHRRVGTPAASQAAKPWLAPTFPQAIEELATILSERYADVIAAELRFLIPGIIDTRISR